ncbi:MULTISPECIES: hypothetical protein [Polymorphospora]|uniref:Secreted protein n=1 Tax=Polymorphospora lycopeni TaxID=3140240 RepID=A0ABV5CXK9_9ACTN
MKRILVTAALGLLAAGGFTLAALPAQAGSVSCDSSGFSGSNGGRAWANGCDHSGDHGVRLWGDCELSPSTVYSPWQYGSFTNYNFQTSTCTFGVNASGFQH